MRLAALVLSLLLCSPAWATVNVVRFPSGTPVQVCQPSDTNTNCGGGGSSGLTIGTTPIVSGTNTYLEYNNNGKLGEIPQSTFVTGTPWTSTTLLLDQTTPQTIINGTPIIPSINGSSAANGILTLQGTSNATRTASYLNLQPNGGNVGIGTTSPAGKLQIYGAPTANTGYGTLSLGGGVFDGGTGTFAGNANGTSLAVNEATGYTGDLMDFQVNGTKVLTLTGGGSAYLYPILNLVGAANASINLQNNWFMQAGASGQFVIQHYSDNVPLFYIKQYSPYSIGVGYNNNSPTGTLEVYNALASTGATQLLVQGGAAAGDATTNNLFQINQGGGTTALMVVQGSGNVGIRTTSPTGLLNVLGVTEQERLSYDSTHYSSHTVNSAGDLTFSGTTGKVTVGSFVSNGALKTNLLTGSNAGTPVTMCTDANGALCACTTCA